MKLFVLLFDSDLFSAVMFLWEEDWRRKVNLKTKKNDNNEIQTIEHVIEHWISKFVLELLY